MQSNTDKYSNYLLPLLGGAYTILGISFYYIINRNQFISIDHSMAVLFNIVGISFYTIAFEIKTNNTFLAKGIIWYLSIIWIGSLTRYIMDGNVQVSYLMLHFSLIIFTYSTSKQRYYQKKKQNVELHLIGFIHIILIFLSMSIVLLYLEM